MFQTVEPPQSGRPALPIDWDVKFTSYTLNGPVPEWLVNRKKSIDEQLAKLTAKMVGIEAPSFKLRDLEGHAVSLMDLRSKVVLIDFWATWCGPCRTELPILASLEKTWGAKGLVVVRITDEPPEDVQFFVLQTHEPVATLVNGGEVSKQYSVGGIPTLVLIDKTGKIVAYDPRPVSEIELTARLAKAD